MLCYLRFLLFNGWTSWVLVKRIRWSVSWAECARFYRPRNRCLVAEIDGDCNCFGLLYYFHPALDI